MAKLSLILLKQIMYDLAENDDFDREEIATYEEVARLFPQPQVDAHVLEHHPVHCCGRLCKQRKLPRRVVLADPGAGLQLSSGCVAQPRVLENIASREPAFWRLHQQLHDETLCLGRDICPLALVKLVFPILDVLE